MDGAFVDVVLLACDGERWLPDALAALDAQSRSPDRLALVDAASGDASAAVLTRHASRSRLVGGPAALDVLHLRRGAGLLDAARAALAVTDAEALTAPAAVPATGRPDQHTQVPAGLRWVWLLHDDCAPAPDALERLLAAVEVAPSVGVAGCKVVDWDDERLLHQVGFSTSSMGRRLTGVEHGDRDQGQRDHRDDVLAVSSAGMLVRRDLLERLGGDPGLTVLGEDLDLCRRARLAGSRVVVVPGAVVRHVDATRSGLRPTPAARAVRWSERRDEAHARLAGASPLALPAVALAVLLGGLARLLVRVAAKQPDRAGAELGAVLAALARPRRVLTARRTAARTAVRSRSSLRPLMVPRREVVRWHRDRWARTGITPATGVLPVVAARALAAATTPPSGLPVVRLPGAPPLPAPRTALADDLLGPLQPPEQPTEPRPEAHAPSPSSTSTVDDDGADHDADDGAAPRRGLRLLLPLLVLLVVVSLAGQHRLLAAVAGGREVVGGALAAAPGLADLWSAARSDWQPLGMGTAAPADPWLSALAVLALPLGGSVRAAVLVLLLLAVPLAALGGWAAAGAATRSRVLRTATAVVWAGGAPLLAATSTGRLGAVAAHLALPWVALGLARTATAAARRPALAAGALAGLASAVAVAGAPLLLGPLLVAVAVVALTARRWPGALLWAVLPPLAVAGPLLGPALADPRALLLGPGLPLAGPASAPPGQPEPLAGLRLLLGDPGAVLVPAGPPSWVALLAVLPGAVLLVLAVLGAAARGPRGRLVRVAWWASGLGLVAAAAAVAAGGWPGAGTSLVLAGLTTAALARAPRVLRAAPRDDDLEPHHSDDVVREAGEEVPRARRRPAGTRAAALVAVVVVAAPLALLSAWALQQSGGGPVGVLVATAGDPAVARDAARSPDAVATLHLSLTTGPDGADSGPVTAATATVRRGPLTLASTSVAAQLVAAGGGGAQAASTGAAADAAVRSATALLVAGTGDPRADLASLGVGYVLLQGSGAASATDPATARLDAVPGLTRAGSTDAGVLYRVLPASGGGDDAPDRPARARLLAADGAVLAALPSVGDDVDAVVPASSAQDGAGDQTRTAVVAVRSDRGWTASLDGRPLPVVTVDGWALGVELPAEGGHLVVTRDAAPADVWDVLQAAVLLLTALLAVPVPVRGRRAP